MESGKRWRKNWQKENQKSGKWEKDCVQFNNHKAPQLPTTVRPMCVRSPTFRFLGATTHYCLPPFSRLFSLAFSSTAPGLTSRAAPAPLSRPRPRLRLRLRTAKPDMSHRPNYQGGRRGGGGGSGRRGGGGRGGGGRGGRGEQRWWDPVWRAERLRQKAAEVTLPSWDFLSSFR